MSSLGVILNRITTEIKIPIKKIGDSLKRQKEKERIKNAKEAKFEIGELKKELEYREKELKEIELKKLEKEKKQAIKLKKILKKS